MIAVVPLNVAALRVGSDDASGVTPRFKGRSAQFDKMPYAPGTKVASTGDAVFLDLAKQDGATESLGAGIHVHWELPDYFRRGVQPSDSTAVVFPHAPNRWLVIRYLRVYDFAKQNYGSVITARWIVESDCVAATRQVDPKQDPLERPAVTVPLPVGSSPHAQPYQLMGRVVPIDEWQPSGAPGMHYLRDYKASDGTSLYLTAIGFVGPVFSAFYPECCSVFGLWDRFLDVPEVNSAIRANTRLRFVASYHVIGWVDDPQADPLPGMAGAAQTAYDARVKQCQAAQVQLDTTFGRVFADSAAHDRRWMFGEDDVAPEAPPTRTLCSGILQEELWDHKTGGEQPGFLNALWSDTVAIAVGNTTQEALAATLRRDLGNTSTDPDVMRNDEFLIHALLLGQLYGLEQKTNKIVDLEEALHGMVFARVPGGHLWAVQSRASAQDDTPDPDEEVELPPALAEKLAKLNTAQKAHDAALAALAAMRSQLFMDWFRYIQFYAENNSDGKSRLSRFLTQGGLSPQGSGALAVVHRTAQTTGVLLHQTGKDGDILLKPADGTLARQVYALQRRVAHRCGGR